jgi:hydrogenase nickel incorporation protein HypB
MCGVCGCGSPADLQFDALDAPHVERSQGRRHLEAPLLTSARTIQLQADVLGHNNSVAAHNRAHFLEHGVLALNLVSSPGSGKTTLLCSVIEQLLKKAQPPELAVIEGDQQTSRDADRVRALGVPALQINTGKGCHLDAAMVADAFGRLHMHAHGPQGHGRASGAILFIENVGNLVCPALWDLGERAKVVVLSVTEGDDKPLKYPDMFAAAALLVVNKIDLLPYVNFDVDACTAYARRVRPELECIEVSATRGDGMHALLAWLQREAAAFGGHAAHHAHTAHATHHAR